MVKFNDGELFLEFHVLREIIIIYKSLKTLNFNLLMDMNNRHFYMLLTARKAIVIEYNKSLNY